MTTPITEEQSSTDEEVETEKDHTSLIAPIKEYHQRLDISLKTYEHDLAELIKIKARLQADANNLSTLNANLGNTIARMTEAAASKTLTMTFSSGCIEAIIKAEKASEEVKAA